MFCKLPLIAYLYVKDEDNHHYSRLLKACEWCDIEIDMWKKIKFIILSLWNALSSLIIIITNSVKCKWLCSFMWHSYIMLIIFDTVTTVDRLMWVNKQDYLFVNLIRIVWYDFNGCDWLLWETDRKPWSSIAYGIRLRAIREYSHRLRTDRSKSDSLDQDQTI
jgi:hypothetical protein